MTDYTASTTVTASSNGTYVIECIAAGGAGRKLINQANSGGGGAAYAKKTLVVTAGQVLTLTVPVGVTGTSSAGATGGDCSVKIGTTTHCLAKGGAPQTGGAAASCVGDTKFSGGAGGSGGSYTDPDTSLTSNYTGGGGGAAGSAGNGGAGGNADTVNGGHGVAGQGAAGTFPGGDGSDGSGVPGPQIPGGGAALGATSARGQIRMVFTASNTAPSITSSASSSVAENLALAKTLSATDAEGGTLTWSIRTVAQDATSLDASEFSLSATTGSSVTLRWVGNGTKNFEAPDDSNSDNIYKVVVRVTDSGGLFDDQTVTITVTDVSEVHTLAATGVATSAPVIGVPAVGQKHVFAAVSFATVSPQFGVATMGQKHVLGVTSLAASSPVLGSPALVSIHNLTATGKTTASPATGAPALGQKHILLTTGFATGPPFFATPGLGLLPTVLQIVRPGSVISPGGWTDQDGGSAIAAALDETVASDVDYARSLNNPTDDILRIKLAPFLAIQLFDPKLRYRLWRSGSDASITQTVRLYQGATLIGGPWVHNFIAPTTVEQAIDRTLITNPDDLYLEVEAK